MVEAREGRGRGERLQFGCASEKSKPLGITSIWMVTGSISTVGLSQGDLRPPSLCCEWTETFCHSLNNKMLACQRLPHNVSTVQTNRCTSAVLAVMSLPSPVVFWYIDLLCDAEHGGFKAVQRVLSGLLRRPPGVLHLWCLEGSPEKRRCSADTHWVSDRHCTLVVVDHMWDKIVADQILAP